MPNIRAQRVEHDSVYIQASDGREFTVTRAEVNAYWNTLTGTAAQKGAQTVAWFAANVQAALGLEQVPSVNVKTVIDGTTRAIASLEIS
jgi:restriction endonuclease Mrr